MQQVRSSGGVRRKKQRCLNLAVSTRQDIALHNYPLQPRSRGAFFFPLLQILLPEGSEQCSQDGGVVRLEHVGTGAAQGCAAAYRVSVLPVGADAFSSSASQRIPATAVRADYEFAKAFYTPTPPRPRLGILRRLERRCSGRLHSRCADRNGTRTRSISNCKPSHQAEKEECVAHGYLLGSPVGNVGASLRFRCCSKARVYAHCPETEKIDVYLIQAKLEPSYDNS